MRRILCLIAASVLCASSANSATTYLNEFRDLDPTASYGVIWAPVELEEYTEVRAATEEIDDINAFFDMEGEGMIVVASITRFDEDGSTLVYDGGFDTEEIGGPSVQGRACYYPIAWTQSREKVSSISFQVYKGKSHDVEYAPKCGSYPCTRTAKGEENGFFSPDVSTDFFWRSNWGTFNYWTTQVNGRTWYVSLYSGDSTINYMERSCSYDYTSIVLRWW